MFSNLSKGSVLYGLDNKEGVKLFTGTVPTNNVIADFGPNTLVLSDSKESLVNYVKSLRQTSKNIIDSCPKHKALVPQYDKVLQELNPELINESAVKELRDQVGSLQSQLAEALALLKGEDTNKK